MTMNTSATVTLTFRSPDGTTTAVTAPVGQSVMQAALFNNVDGIEAECGGSCMCATCHVYLSDPALEVVAALSEEEDAMLEETAAQRKPESRLSCQLVITPELDGMIFDVPECQS
jgi:2Fe-2S ferredoxin